MVELSHRSTRRQLSNPFLSLDATLWPVFSVNSEFETTDCTDFPDYEEAGTWGADIFIDFPDGFCAGHCQVPWLQSSVKSVQSVV